MIKSYANQGSRDVAEGVPSARARRILPVQLHDNALVKLNWLEAAEMTKDLGSAPNSYHVEKLKGDRAGQYSIRINEQFRICFQIVGKDVSNVEICDYH